MLELHHKRRWVFGPVKADGLPLAGEYAQQFVSFLPHEGKCMTYCEFNAQQLAAARACPDIVVMDSAFSPVSIHDVIATHYAGHGLLPGMSHHDALVTLAKHHPAFEPAN